ncbi:MAG: hypothetical protein E7541_06425 [Ruminococcaceae bacterium]|nr:hypothetical protein [Oscillospiraceae bacterium]
MSNTMIGLLIILGSIFAHLFEGMIVKGYGQKHGKGGMFFNAVLCLFATMYFFVTDTGGFQLSTGVFYYGVCNSLLYAVGFYTGYLALASGSFGLTRLCTSFGVFLPIIYGFAAGENVTYLTIIGTVLVVTAVILMMSRNGATEDTPKITTKWVVSVILMILSNAAISIVGKLQNNAFGNTYKNEYLIVSFLGAAVWLAILGFIYERQNLRTVLRYGILFGMAAGLFNGINNLLILITYDYIPDLSTISPIKGALSKVISFLVAVFIYREKFTKRQWLGVGVGILAVLLISL